VLLCDEPAGALDYDTGKIVLTSIKRANEELGTAVVIITHKAEEGATLPATRSAPPHSLDLSVSDTLTDIVAERFDAGIRLGERIERDMIAVRVTDELPFVVGGSPAYFEQRANPRRQTILSGTTACVSDFQAAPTCPGAFALNAAISKSTSRAGSASIRWPSLDRPLSTASRWYRRRQFSLRGISQHAGL
jgi:DNA-binding transcriptional LysR family regulator